MGGNAVATWHVYGAWCVVHGVWCRCMCAGVWSGSRNDGMESCHVLQQHAPSGVFGRLVTGAMLSQLTPLPYAMLRNTRGEK